MIGGNGWEVQGFFVTRNPAYIYCCMPPLPVPEEEKCKKILPAPPPPYLVTPAEAGVHFTVDTGFRRYDNKTG